MATPDPKSSHQIAQLVRAVTFLSIFLLLTRTPIDADIWWHLRAGQVMWESRSLLLEDVFSYTLPGAPWVNAFWISEILFFLLHEIGGYFALTVFVAASGAATFFIVSRRITANPFIGAFALILAAITAAPIWGPRPQLFSFLLVAALDFWLADPKRPRWALIPLFALWANLHGGWIWGFLLLTAHAAGLGINTLLNPGEHPARWRELRSLLGWAALAALAVGLNPNGLGIWQLPFQQVNVSMAIQEWRSPDFHRVDFHPFLWMLFLLLLTAPFAPRPLDWGQAFKALGFAYLTFVAQRNIALFAITAAPLLAHWSQSALQPLMERAAQPGRNLPARLRRLINAVLIGLLMLAALANAWQVSQPEQVDKNYPIGAVNWLRENQPAGHLFNSYNWGGYLVWRLPEYPVFIDGRADLYGSDLLEQWHTVVNNRPGAIAILDEWQVQTVFLEPEWPIVSALLAQGWQPAYQDNMSIILRRP